MLITMEIISFLKTIQIIRDKLQNISKTYMYAKYCKFKNVVCLLKL